MEQLIDKPAFLDEDTRDRRFRFDKPNALILQVLMCVRITSGLHAALALLRNYHTTEMAVLFRTIDDFLADAMFVDEVIEKGEASATAAQKKFLEQYFVDEKFGPTQVAKVDLGRRQKVQASEARTLGGENPDRVKKLVKP